MKQLVKISTPSLILKSNHQMIKNMQMNWDSTIQNLKNMITKLNHYWSKIMDMLNIIYKSKVALIVLVLILLGFTQQNLQAQNHNDGYFNPDSLKQVTLSGTAIVDSSFMHPMYYLDTNSNGTADYILNFGPYWYEPDEGTAARPADGEAITVTGGLHNVSDSLNIVVVYKINGEFWRDAYEPMWDNMGHHSHSGSHHQGDCQGYAFGFDHDTLTNTTVSGTALVDTTFFMGSYYLDQDGDGLPDYFLNFGPPWYEPGNGAQRPKNGDQVNIIGGLINNDSIPMVIVYRINGVEWRDSNSIGNHLGGGWADRNMSDSLFIHSTFDDDDWMRIQPGWYKSGGMHGGGMMTDSLFFQMMEVFPQNIPYTDSEDVFAGYEIGVFLPDGSNNMWNGGGCGGMMNFNSSIDFNLHFTEKQIAGLNIAANNIQAQYWDSQSNSWQVVPNSSVNLSTGTVSFNLSTVSNYIILTTSPVTAVEYEGNNNLINSYELSQNYPNPFNPSTVIKYSIQTPPASSLLAKGINDAGFVSLKVYNVLGEEVATLVNKEQAPGSYEVIFDAANLTSGIYFYQLKSGNFLQVKKMILLR